MMNKFLNLSLKGKVAPVTGASHGIDFAIASVIAKRGATICFNKINQELVEKDLASYKEKEIKIHGYAYNVTDKVTVQNLSAIIGKKVETVDILINNTGISHRIPMHELKAADFRHVIDFDLHGPFIASKSFLSSMMKIQSGKIINICSMMTELGRETVSAYAAAKSRLKMFTRNIYSEYG